MVSLGNDGIYEHAYTFDLDLESLAR